MAERPWGFWTESKLDMLSAYLPAFTTASKSAPSTVYLDLFGGQATNVSLHEAFRAGFPNRDVVVHAGDVHDALQSARRARMGRWWETG